MTSKTPHPSALNHNLDQHYHPLILQRLRSLFAANDWEGLQTYLAELSNAHFRTAGYMIGERLMPDTRPADFWEVMLRLIRWQPKAFTVTMAKAAMPRLIDGTLTINDAGFLSLAEYLRSDERWIDRQKLLMQWLPAARDPMTIERLFDLMNVDDPRKRADFLLRTEGMAAAFVLLRTLRFEEHDRPWLTQVCRTLMKRGDNLSFNVASMLREFFDLQELKGIFSLHLQPFELSRLDTDFDTFKRVARKV